MRVYEVAPGRWAYQVGAVVQEWHPTLPGFVAMSRGEAEALASELSAPPQAQPEVAGVSKLAFMSRFTEAELVSVYAAARQSPVVEVWLDKLKLTEGNILLDDPRTIAGVHALEAFGLVGQGRASEILA